MKYNIRGSFVNDEYKPCDISDVINYHIIHPNVPSIYKLRIRTFDLTIEDTHHRLLYVVFQFSNGVSVKLPIRMSSAFGIDHLIIKGKFKVESNIPFDRVRVYGVTQYNGDIPLIVRYRHSFILDMTYID